MKLVRLTLILILAALAVLAAVKWFGDSAGREELARAEELFVNGKPEAARQAFADFVRNHHDSELLPRALLGLARIEDIQLDNPLRAVQAYRRLAALFPNSPAALQAREAEARLLARHLGDPLAAVVLLRELQHRKPAAWDVYQYQIGRIWFATSDYSKAEQIYGQLIDQKPKSSFGARAAIGLADVYYVQDKVGLALKAYGQVVSAYPDTPEAMRARFRIANCLEEAGRLKEARQAYRALKDVYPNPEAVKIRLRGLDKRLKEVAQ